MNKMEKILSESGNSLLKKRAAHVASMVKMEQDSLTNDLYKEVMNLEQRLAEVTDLSITSRDSLVVGPDGFNAEEFCKEVQNIKVKLRNKRIEYEIARNTKDELFTEIDDDSKEEDK